MRGPKWVAQFPMRVGHTVGAVGPIGVALSRFPKSCARPRPLAKIRVDAPLEKVEFLYDVEYWRLCTRIGL